MTRAVNAVTRAACLLVVAGIAGVLVAMSLLAVAALAASMIGRMG